MRRVYFIAVVVLFILSWSASWAHTPSKVITVGSELAGIKKTGGLAEAVLGLLKALSNSGVRSDYLMPHYLQMNSVNTERTGMSVTVGLDYRHGYAHKQSIFEVESNSEGPFRVLFFRHLEKPYELNYFDSSKNQHEANPSKYTPNIIEGEAWGAWAKGVADFVISQNYELVILNDWHSALVAVFIDMAKLQGKTVPKVVTTIHNAAFQGVFPYELMPFLGIPDEYFKMKKGIEYWGQMNFLKAAVEFSDALLAVAPNYAKEITTTDEYGAGLEGVFRKAMSKGKLASMLNGITSSEWNPRDKISDDFPWTFSDDGDFSGKELGKLAMQKKLGLPSDRKVPVFALTSRITEQKGFEYLIPALRTILSEQDVQIIILGDGAHGYVSQLTRLRDEFSSKLHYSGHDDELEKIVLRFSDFFLSASRFEPAGLNQQFSLALGTIPIVPRTGGLDDSVEDQVTGFKFNLKRNSEGRIDIDATAKEISDHVGFANHTYKNNPEFINRLRRAGMQVDNSWDSRVKEYYLKFLKYVMANGPARLQEKNLRDHLLENKIVTIHELVHLSEIESAHQCQMFYKRN